MNELTEYQRGLIDGFVSGLKPQRQITDKSRHTYNIKHDFEALLRVNNVPSYISQELAEQILKAHGFRIEYHSVNINSNVAMEDTRRRLDKSSDGQIVTLDWNGELVDWLGDDK
ncbi:hypothetical protein [Leuconostoc pseudomesenteroides]|uniref:hypothetical protein n=1 Tax=Leuconostoc pseudomesenteroides TaxID=33968 RepID=UPI0032DEDE76